jgi:hypothetical protein
VITARPAWFRKLTVQARLADYSAKFNEAAQKYHELSFDVSIDEEERTQMLYISSPRSQLQLKADRAANQP